MLSATDARILAEKYVNDFGEILPGIHYGVGDMQEFKGCYYFDFNLVYVRPRRKDEYYGDAPGFIIDKITGEPTTVALWQLNDLQNQ